MPFILFMTDHNHSVNPVGEPAATKEDAARLVRDALQTAGIPLAGIAWRPIADGLMQSPTGEAVLGVHGYHFLIEEAAPVAAPIPPDRSNVRWRIRKDADIADRTPYVWFVYAPDWEQLNQNHDVACIEGGSHATWDEALLAAFQGCALDRATNGGWVEPPAEPPATVPSGACQYPPGCDAPAMPGFRACQPHYILVGALLGNPDDPAPSDEAIAWANRVTHTTTV